MYAALRPASRFRRTLYRSFQGRVADGARLCVHGYSLLDEGLQPLVAGVLLVVLLRVQKAS
jgi:hypothetical protein